MWRTCCGAVVLSLLVMPGPSFGQEPEGVPRGGQVEAGGAAPAGEVSPRELRLLRQQVATLGDEVARLRARMDLLEQERSGVGGAGTGGTQAPARGGKEEGGGTAVTQAFLTGVLEDVSEDHIVLEVPDGQVFTLRITAATQATRDGRPVDVKDLPVGARVQAAYDLGARDSFVSQIVVLQAQPTRPTGEAPLPGGMPVP